MPISYDTEKVTEELAPRVKSINKKKYPLFIRLLPHFVWIFIVRSAIEAFIIYIADLFTFPTMLMPEVTKEFGLDHPQIIGMVSDKQYFITGYSINCSNDRNGQVMVHYLDNEGKPYCRDKEEFMAEFTSI
jgi:hypothetical protein